ncbi:dual specificity phosphatase [Cryptosporidium sp. chipmunk genotype I]|uniref:dual specificity phosphatase n=1 Tax=Cryptosporidium sp. chipmunk genotype I TaxID=1280935 RepID=UPI00351A62A9|nr:dual specificity phosphatase [Cryptosporidium sp. chipmunk genotype I]
MMNHRAIEYNRLLNESRDVASFIRKGKELECRPISNKKLFNICQLLLCRNLKEIEKNSASLINNEPVVICDLRTKNQIIKLKTKINGSIECNSLDRVKRIFPEFDINQNPGIVGMNRKHVIIYDFEGKLTNISDLEISQREVLEYLKKCIQSIKSIYLLKDGYISFSLEFPYICCSVDAECISSIKSIDNIPQNLKSKIIASIEYPLVISWGEIYKIYLGNVLQGCHPQILKSLGIKTIMDFTPNRIKSKSNDGVRIIHVKNSESNILVEEDYLIYSNLPLEEAIKSLKELEENNPDPKDIFPIMVVSTRVTNETVSIVSIIVSYLRKLQITATLIFTLNQIGLDNNIISPTENEEIFNLLHPSNTQIAQMISFNFP